MSSIKKPVSGSFLLETPLTYLTETGGIPWPPPLTWLPAWFFWLCLLSVLCCPPCLCPRTGVLDGSWVLLGPLSSFFPSCLGNLSDAHPCALMTPTFIYSWTSGSSSCAKHLSLLDGPTVYLIGTANLTSSSKTQLLLFCPLEILLS